MKDAPNHAARHKSYIYCDSTEIQRLGHSGLRIYPIPRLEMVG